MNHQNFFKGKKSITKRSDKSGYCLPGKIIVFLPSELLTDTANVVTRQGPKFFLGLTFPVIRLQV